VAIAVGSDVEANRPITFAIRDEFRIDTRGVVKGSPEFSFRSHEGRGEFVAKELADGLKCL
jgi:hypothetical protein